MQLRELLQELKKVQVQIGASQPYICGGTPRDKHMGKLENISDLDICTGDKTVDYLSQEFAIDLRKKYNVTRKTMDDGHSTIFIGSLKMDFSSNFMVHNIDHILQEMGITPTNMLREMYSRDFTCNSLLMTLDLKHIIDPTRKGFQDIADKKIRTCLAPEITLTSNRNRVIRAIYLACKLGFEIDDSIVAYVRKNPETVKISTEKVTIEKLNDAFKKNPEKAVKYINAMHLWDHIPITEPMRPFYEKAVAVPYKKAYFQGGGGVNEPTPGEKKYKSDPAIVVQPRFKEPFYRNYDLYTIPGMEHIGPGTGWHGLQNYKSVQDFLKDRRERLKPRYVADDSWQIDSGDRVKKNPDRKARMAIFEKIMKAAGPNYDLGKGLYQEMSDGKVDSVEEFREEGNHGPGAFFADDNDDNMMGPKEHGTSIYDAKNSIYQGTPKSPVKDKNKGDDNELGYGFYENLEKYKSVRDFIEHTPLGPGHGAKIKPEWERAKHPIQKVDDNDIDFPIDDTINHDDLIYPERDEYEIRRMKGDVYDFPSEGSPLGQEDLNISLTTPQIAGEHTYLPDPDFEGKPDNGSQLDFGRDYTEEDLPGRQFDFADADDIQMDLDGLESKYLESTETGILGLPDGVDPEGHDAEQTKQVEQPYDTISDISREMYEDKWNI